MTLAYADTVSSANLTDVINRDGASEVLACRTSSNLITRYNVNTRAVLGTPVALTITPQNMGMLTADLVAVMGSTTSTAIVNLVAETETVQAGLASVATSGKGQQCAGNANGRAYGCTSTAGRLIKFTDSPSQATFDPPWLVSQNAYAVIAKGTTGFIFATSGGKIVETNVEGTLVHEYTIPGQRHVFDNDNVDYQLAMYLYYTNGYLAVTTPAGNLILFDHESGEELYRVPCPSSSSRVRSCPIAGSSNCLVLVTAENAGSQASIVQYDILRTPPTPEGYFFPPTTWFGITGSIGINGTVVWTFNRSNGQILFLDLSGVRTVDFQTTDFDDSGAVGGRMLVIEDNGVGTAKVMFATSIPASGSKEIPVTDGQDVIKLGMRGAGYDEQVDLRRP